MWSLTEPFTLWLAVTRQIDGQYAIGQSSQQLEIICHPPSDRHLAEGVRKVLALLSIILRCNRCSENRAAEYAR